MDAPISILNEHFKKTVMNTAHSKIFLRDIKRYRIVDEDNNLTRRGRELLRDLLVSEDA